MKRNLDVPLFLSEDVPLVQPPAKVRDDPALSIYVPGQVFGLVSIDSKG